MNIFEIFLEKLPILREMVFFTKEDLVEIWIDNNIFSKLLDWKLIRIIYYNIYSLNEEHVTINEKTLILFWLKYNEKSYISHESALKHHKIYLWKTILDFSTKNLDEDIFLFNKHIKYRKWSGLDNQDNVSLVRLDIGNRSVWKTSKLKYKIASPELALIDLFYSYDCVLSEEDIDAYGFNVSNILKIINNNILLDLANQCNKNVIITTKNFINWINSWNYERDTIVW